MKDLIIQKSIRHAKNEVDNVYSVSNKEGFIIQSEQFKDRTVASKNAQNYKIVEKMTLHIFQLVFWINSKNYTTLFIDGNHDNFTGLYNYPGVGNKEDYIMNSLDFEKFLWEKGYTDEQINDLYKCMIELKPLSDIQYNVMMCNFKEYMIVGGMPAIVNQFVTNKNFSGILKMQQQILLDYEENITKYEGELDKKIY